MFLSSGGLFTGFGFDADARPHVMRFNIANTQQKANSASSIPCYQLRVGSRDQAVLFCCGSESGIA
jgi:hypothetical protein